MSLGSSAEPIGGGSTYLRVVRSCNEKISGHYTTHTKGTRPTLLRVDLHLHVKVDAQNDEIRDDIENADAQKDLRVFEGYLLGYLHHSENDEQIGAIETLVSAKRRLDCSYSSCDHCARARQQEHTSGD